MIMTTMMVKVVYLNGLFENVRDIISIRTDGYEYVLEDLFGNEFRYDIRLKLEVKCFQ